ncbi:MAG TPA: ATP synthase F0 subunit B [Terracidiphilus sp.]|nr:ATP synthase F0 subunit B [Terracidiphilus sp.]
MVQSIAKKFNLSVENTARFFEIINFAILVVAIGIPLVRVLPRILRKRSETLRHNIESARRVTEDANARLSAVEARLSKLDDEIAEIRNHVEEESKQDEIRIKATIEEESGRIVAAAEQEIGLAAAQARRGLQNFAAGLAIDRAVKQLELTPETDQALIAEFMYEASNGAAKGGRS